MSHFACRCGYDIRDITCPSTHQARLVTDMEQDNGPLCTTDGTGSRNIHVDPMDSREVMECPKCKRLWIQKEPWQPGVIMRYVCYLPDGESLDLAEQQGGYRG